MVERQGNYAGQLSIKRNSGGTVQWETDVSANNTGITDTGSVSLAATYQQPHNFRKIVAKGLNFATGTGMTNVFKLLINGSTKTTTTKTTGTPNKTFTYSTTGVFGAADVVTLLVTNAKTADTAFTLSLTLSKNQVWNILG